MAKYVFILGRKQLISMAELIARLPASTRYLNFQFDQLYVETPEIKDPQSFLDTLGGSIKIIRIDDELAGSANDCYKALTAFTLNLFKDRTDKVRYAYFAKTLQIRPEIFLKNSLTLTKKSLKSAGISSRFINNNFQNAVVALLKGENILGKGAEICALEIPKTWLIGQTVAIQDIDNYSIRDFERPERDARIGMLPPKLAQILINLTGITKGTVFDPFCGVGTVLMEANLMGLDAAGTDLNPETSAKARENLRWAHEKYALKTKCLIQTADATHLTDSLIGPHVTAIVSETWLGPPKKETPEPAKIERTFAEIEHMLGKFLTNLHPLLAPGTPLVLTLLTYRNTHHLGPKFYSMDDFIDAMDQFGYKLQPLIPEETAKSLHLKTSDPLDRLLYEREDQVACRTIIKLVRS